MRSVPAAGDDRFGGGHRLVYLTLDQVQAAIPEARVGQVDEAIEAAEAVIAEREG